MSYQKMHSKHTAQLRLRRNRCTVAHTDIPHGPGTKYIGTALIGHSEVIQTNKRIEIVTVALCNFTQERKASLDSAGRPGVATI